MAGLGRKVFTPGEVLTATNVQNYLMDQAVQVYAGTAARGSAIGSATTEGMVSWLADSNKLQAATGTATWVDVYPPVVTSGLLPVGTIVQVVSTTKTSTEVSSSTTYVDISGMSVTITPKSTANNIFIGVTMSFGVSNDAWISTKLLRGSTDIYTTSSMRFSSNTDLRSATGFFLDSPNTTSATTYKIQWANILAGGAAMTLNRRGFDTDVRVHSTIYVLEVVA